MRKVLITGVLGFAGGFLAEHLLSQKNFSITGTYLSDHQLQNVSYIKDKIELEKLDLLNEEKTSKLIKALKPDIVFHLAALTSPSESFLSPALTITNNITAQVNLLEALKNSGVDAKILIISSADIYGVVDRKDLPIDEQTPLMPVNPYAVSKVAQDFLGLEYFLSYGLKVVRVRPFNHIGPRQSSNFVVASFAKQIAEIEKGKKDNIISVGNLSSKRDFTDVRDMMEAYLLAIEKGKIGDVYNIGSGISHSISEILEILLSLSAEKIKIEIDKKLFRPKDEPELVCNNSYFVKQTGWQPKIPIKKTLEDTLDYWRNIV